MGHRRTVSSGPPGSMAQSWQSSVSCHSVCAYIFNAGWRYLLPGSDKQMSTLAPVFSVGDGGRQCESVKWLIVCYTACTSPSFRFDCLRPCRHSTVCPSWSRLIPASCEVQTVLRARAHTSRVGMLIMRPIYVLWCVVGVGVWVCMCVGCLEDLLSYKSYSCGCYFRLGGVIGYTRMSLNDMPSVWGGRSIRCRSRESISRLWNVC